MNVIKECLNVLKERDIDPRFSRKVSQLNNLDDWQLGAVLYNGVRLDNPRDREHIVLKFYENVGFRCSNDPTHVGELPVCQVVERILNRRYKELLKKWIDEQSEKDQL